MATKSDSERNRFVTAFAATVILVVAAAPHAVSEASTPLATFHPGSPDEPAWTMSKLDVARGDAEVRVRVQFTDVRCPMTWGFVFFEGTPEEARPTVGGIFNFAMGQGGVIAYTAGDLPVHVHRSTVQDDGAESCPKSPGFVFVFPQLPVGEIHLLHFYAGTPFLGTAEVTAPSGGVTLLDSTSGMGTHYVNSTGFSAGALRAGFHSPPTETQPNVEPQGGIWNPCCYRPGDSLAGADVSVDRAVSLAFERQPFYSFGSPATLKLDQSSVEDPTGRVWRSSESSLAYVSDLAINSQGIFTGERVSEYPSGTYDFRIDKSAAIGAQRGVPWHIWAVDYHFPGT